MAWDAERTWGSVTVPCWRIQFIVKSGNIIRKSDLFFSFLIKSFQVRGHIRKQLAQNHLERNLKPTKPHFSLNVGVIWWGGSECAWLFVFTKGRGSGEFKGFKGIEPNEPPSPKKAILRDYEQPFSFNKGPFTQAFRGNGIDQPSLTGYCHIWVSGDLDVLQIGRETKMKELWMVSRRWSWFFYTGKYMRRYMET